jgi:hypothetical protein
MTKCPFRVSKWLFEGVNFQKTGFKTLISIQRTADKDKPHFAVSHPNHDEMPVSGDEMPILGVEIGF